MTFAKLSTDLLASTALGFVNDKATKWDRDNLRDCIDELHKRATAHESAETDDEMDRQLEEARSENEALKDDLRAAGETLQKVALLLSGFGNFFAGSTHRERLGSDMHKFYRDQADKATEAMNELMDLREELMDSAARTREPIGVEVVGVVRPSGEDGPQVEWLLEGGLHAVAEGGETYLLVAHEPITDDNGHGQVYRAG